MWRRRGVVVAVVVALLSEAAAVSVVGAADASSDPSTASTICVGESVSLSSQRNQYAKVEVPVGGSVRLSGSGMSTYQPRGLGPNGLPLWRTGGLVDLRVKIGSSQLGVANDFSFDGPSSIESTVQPDDVGFTIHPKTISVPAGGTVSIESQLRFWFDGQPYGVTYAATPLDASGNPYESPSCSGAGDPLGLGVAVPYPFLAKTFRDDAGASPPKVADDPDPSFPHCIVWVSDIDEPIVCFQWQSQRDGYVAQVEAAVTSSRLLGTHYDEATGGGPSIAVMGIGCDIEVSLNDTTWNDTISSSAAGCPFVEHWTDYGGLPPAVGLGGLSEVVDSTTRTALGAALDNEASGLAYLSSISGYEADPDSTFGGTDSTGAAADPVDVSSGNFFDTWTDLSFGGSLSMLDVERTYNSLDSRVGVLGQGWSTAFDASATTLPDGSVEIRTPEGRVVTFEPDGSGGLVRPIDFHADAATTASGVTVDFFDGSSWVFDASGDLAVMASWDGQTVTLNRTGAGAPASKVWDSGTGDTETVTYTVDGAGLVTSISDSAARAVTYGRDASGQLVSVTGADGGVETFTLNASGVITDMFDEAGRLVIRNTYDTDGRVIQQEFAAGNTVTFSYDDPARTTTVTDIGAAETTTYINSAERQLVSMVDTTGGVAERTYDADGNLVTAIDRRGQDVIQTFDANGNVLSTTDRAGDTTTYTYDAENRVLSVTDSDGDTTTFTYTGANRIPASITDALGATTTVVSSNGLVTQVTDPDGVAVSYTYDTARNLLTTTNGLGDTTTFAYDSQGRRTSTTSPEGNISTTAYDADGRIVASTDPTGATTTTTYDASGRVATITDPTGAITSYTYDTQGRTATSTDGLGQTTTYAYNAAGDLVGVTDPDSGTRTTSYGDLARRESTTDASGVTTTFGYDADGNLTTTTNQNGETVTTTYDAEGRPVARTDALGNTSTTAYDSDGRVASVTDPNGNAVTYGYDAAGRLASMTYADGAVETRTYTTAGRLATTTDANGNTTTYGYDAAGRLSTVTNAAGDVLTTTYDGDGRAISTTAPSGLLTAMTYDAAGRPLTSTGPTGDITSATYTTRGELASQTDPTGATIGYSYDAVGQVTAVVNANGGTTSYGYDGTGSRTSRTSALGDTETWTYDAADRPLSVTDQNGDTATSTYDAVGRLVTSTDATGRTMTLTYDAAGRVTGITHAGGTDSYAVTYGYDAGGRRTSMVDPDGTWSWTYDSRNRVTQVVEPDGTTIGYGYDANGNRTATTYPDGTTVTYNYDSLNRLSSVVHPTFGTTTYTYDADGRPLSENLPDGNSRSWTYTDGRMTSFTDSQTGTSTVAYDAAGRITSTAGAENWTFVYDTAGQLIHAALDARTWDYGYDADGNLILVDDSAEGVTTYTVDAASRLSGGSDPDGATAYAYDAAGRLVSAATGAGEVTEWSYDLRGLPVLITTTTPGYNPNPVPEICAGLTPTITGTAGDDVIVGTSGDDIIFTYGGDDTIDAKQGHDIICAGDGHDTIIGGNGNDRIDAGAGDDTVDANNGDDLIVGGTGTDTLNGDNGVDAIFGGAGNDNITGGNGDDNIAAGTGADIVDAGKGDDIVHGGDGDDTLDGDKGNDLLDGGDHTDSVNGGQGDDTCDDAETATGCETQTNEGEPPGETVTTQTRAYDGLGSLVNIDIDGDATSLTWDHNRGIPQILAMSDASGTADQLYGLTRLAELTTAGSNTYGYSVFGDSNDLGVAFDAYGDPLNEPMSEPGFGYRGELQIGDQVHLRVRELRTGLTRFTTPDPLDGIAGTVVESNPYHYANNDPIGHIDPSGMRSIDASMAFDLEFPPELPPLESGASYGWALPGAVPALARVSGTPPATTAGVGTIAAPLVVAVGIPVAFKLGLDAYEDYLDRRGFAEAVEASARRVREDPTGRAGQLIYRLWGGCSARLGASWTPVNPQLIHEDARNYLGLPDCNTAENMVVLRVIDPTVIVLVRQAQPLDGNVGGLLEYIIPGVEANLAAGRLEYVADYVVKGGL